MKTTNVRYEVGAPDVGAWSHEATRAAAFARALYLAETVTAVYVYDRMARPAACNLWHVSPDGMMYERGIRKQ